MTTAITPGSGTTKAEGTYPTLKPGPVVSLPPARAEPVRLEYWPNEMSAVGAKMVYLDPWLCRWILPEDNVARSSLKQKCKYCT